MTKKIKSVKARIANKEATPETWRRTWRTMLQVFLSVFFAGLATVIPNYGTPEFKIGLFVLLSTAIGAALGHVMNLEDAGGVSDG